MAKPDIELILGGDVSGLHRSLQTAEKSIKTFAQRNEAALRNLDRLALPAAAAFTGLALTVGAVVKTFGDFEATMNQIAAVSGATRKELDAMRASALDLGAKTKFSAKEAAEGMAELTKAGMSANQALAAIPGVLALAAAGGVSVAEAAETASNTLNGFGLAATDATKVADVLAKAANVSAVGVNDLANSMKYIAPIAASSSQSLEEVSTNLAILGNVGIKGSEAGTVMRSALASLVKPSDDAAQKLHDLRIAIQDTSGKMLPLTDIVAQLRENTAKLTEVQRNNAIATIFGQESMTGILALMKQTPEATAAVAAQFRNVAGAADEMSSVMNQGVNASIEQMNGSLETAATQLGEQLAPAVAATAVGIQGLVNGFVSLPGPVKAIIAGLTAGAGAAVLATAALAALGAAIPLVTAGVVALGLATNIAFPLLGALAVTVGIATVAVKAYTDAASAEANKQREANAERVKTVAAAKAQATELGKLSKEYDTLAGKAKRTKDEEARLQEIQAILEKQYPELAKAIKASGGAHDKVVPLIDKERQAKEALTKRTLELAQADIIAAKTAVKAAQTRLAAARADFKTQVDRAPQEAEIRMGAGFAASAMRANVAVDDRTEELAAAEKRLKEATKGLEDIKLTLNPVALPKQNRGGAVDAPAGRGKSQKDLAKEAADKARQAAVDAIQKLESATANSIEIGRAWGKTWQDEVEKTQSLIDALKTKGLDKLKEGQEAIIRAQQRINVLNATAITQYQAEAKAIKEQFADDDAERNRASNADRIAKDIETRRNGELSLAAMQKQMREERRAADASVAVESLDGIEREKAALLSAFDEERRENQKLYGERVQALRAIGKTGIDVSDELLAAEQTRDKVNTEINTRQEAAAKRLAQSYADAVTDIVNSFTSLAVNPSLENLSRVIDGLDPENLRKFGEVAKGAFDSAMVGNVEAFSKALAKADPIALAMFAIAKGIELATFAWSAFDEAMNGTKAMRKALDDLYIGIRKIDSLGEMGMSSEMEVASQKADALKGAIDELTEQYLKEGNAAHRAKIQAKIDELTPQYWEQAFAVGALTEAYNQATGAAKGLTEQAQDALKSELGFIDVQAEQGLISQEEAAQQRLDALKELQKKALQDQLNTADHLEKERLAEFLRDISTQIAGYQGLVDKAEEVKKANEEAAEATEKLADVTKELETGGRDSYGNRISLERERDLQIQNLKAGLAEKETQAVKKRRDLEADILKINQEEAELVAGIENEGLATRAKTEFQDKTERIAKVRQEAQAKRDAKRDELQDLDAQMGKEREATERSISNIKILAAERITALSAERDALNAIIAKANEATAAYERMRAAQYAAASTTSSSGSSSYPKPTPTSNTTTYRQSYFHGGGTRLDPGEKASIIKNNEFVFTPEQFNGLIAMKQAANRVPSGAGNVINITVNGGNGSPQDIARVVRDEMGRVIRQAGFR